MSDFDTAGALIERTVQRFGRIDILANSDEEPGQGTILDTSEADWDLQIQSSLKGVRNTMFHAIPHMRAQHFGRILNCASGAWVGLSGLCAGSAASAGVVGLSKSSARDLGRYGITVNVCCPQAGSPSHNPE